MVTRLAAAETLGVTSCASTTACSPGGCSRSGPDAARALPLVERWRARLAAGDDDEAADRCLELVREAEHARIEGNDPLETALLDAAAEWDDR